MREKWQEVVAGDSAVLVTTDDDMVHLDFDNAVRLVILYSVPHEQYRFDSRMLSMQSILPKNLNPFEAVCCDINNI